MLTFSPSLPAIPLQQEPFIPPVRELFSHLSPLLTPAPSILKQALPLAEQPHLYQSQIQVPPASTPQASLPQPSHLVSNNSSNPALCHLFPGSQRSNSVWLLQWL